MKTGIQLITEERDEQIFKHGRSVQSDVLWNKEGELLDAAVKLTGVIIGIPFPSKWNRELCQKMDSKDVIGKLRVAGALIAAEIDRLQAIPHNIVNRFSNNNLVNVYLATKDLIFHDHSRQEDVEKFAAWLEQNFTVEPKLDQ